MLKKQFIILAVAVVAVAGAAAYLQTQKDAPQAQSDRRVDAPSNVLSENDTSDWKMYRNDLYKFEFRYPAYYELSDALPTTRASRALVNDNLKLRGTDVPQEPGLTLLLNPEGWGPPDPDFEYSYTQSGNLLKLENVTEVEGRNSNQDNLVLIESSGTWVSGDGMEDNYFIGFYFNEGEKDYRGEFEKIMSTFRFLD